MRVGTERTAGPAPSLFERCTAFTSFAVPTIVGGLKRFPFVADRWTKRSTVAKNTK
jgi:hypothetical protein